MDWRWEARLGRGIGTCQYWVGSMLFPPLSLSLSLSAAVGCFALLCSALLFRDGPGADPSPVRERVRRGLGEKPCEARRKEAERRRKENDLQLQPQPRGYKVRMYVTYCTYVRM